MSNPGRHLSRFYGRRHVMEDHSSLPSLQVVGEEQPLVDRSHMLIKLDSTAGCSWGEEAFTPVTVAAVTA